jgi:hypothetical protein
MLMRCNAQILPLLCKQEKRQLSAHVGSSIFMEGKEKEKGRGEVVSQEVPGTTPG